LIGLEVNMDKTEYINVTRNQKQQQKGGRRRKIIAQLHVINYMRIL
jgi:hypothetical protein